MPELTVLMPVYNGAAYLQEAIDSVLGQTYEDFELLVVDDGSTDETPVILDRLRDPRVRVLRSPERLRLSGALNFGWESSRGDFIARMDADDVCRPERFARQMDFLKKNDKIGVCGTAIRRFGAGGNDVVRYPLDGESVRAFALFNTPFSHPSVILRRDFFDRFSLRFNGDYYPTEDYDLWTRALQHFPGANLREPLLDYRVHPESMTQADWGEMDGNATRIMGRELVHLGIAATESEKRFHRDIGMRRLHTSRPSLVKAEAWMLRILATNSRSGVYDQGALQSVAADLWYQLSMRATSLGWWTMKNYCRSPLALPGHRDLGNRALLTLSVLRRGSSGMPSGRR